MAEDLLVISTDWEERGRIDRGEGGDESHRQVDCTDGNGDPMSQKDTRPRSSVHRFF